jgi:hypothetical protein
MTGGCDEVADQDVCREYEPKIQAVSVGGAPHGERSTFDRQVR